MFGNFAKTLPSKSNLAKFSKFMSIIDPSNIACLLVYLILLVPQIASTNLTSALNLVRCVAWSVLKTSVHYFTEQTSCSVNNLFYSDKNQCCLRKRIFISLTCEFVVLRELIEEIAKFEEREFSAKKTVSQVYMSYTCLLHISCSLYCTCSWYLMLWI